MASSGVGRVQINTKPYNIAAIHEGYKVVEIPSHGDVDPKMERRVIYRDFSSGILKHREDRSMDATSSNMPSFSFIRQNRMSLGVYWGNGGDTRSQDRIFAQRANTPSTFDSTTEVPIAFGDASVYSYARGTSTAWALTPPGTWTLSKTFPANTTDAVQFGAQLYIATGSANGFWTWDQTTLTTNWTQRIPTASYFCVIRNQLWRASNANIYSTVNTDPANQVWSGATVIGDPNTPITALDVYQDFILIFKQDGIYSTDRGGNVYPIFPGFKNLGTNPRPLGQWRDRYYFASDVGLVWEWGSNGGGVTRVGFDYAEPFPMNIANAATPFSIPNAVGRGITMTNYFIVGFEQYGATSTSGAYFLAWDGQEWHPFQYFANSSPKSVGMTGGNSNPVVPVLQFGFQNRTTSHYKINYMTNPLIDPFLASSYDTTAQTIYMPVDNGALEDEFKILERIAIWVDNATAGTIRIAYAIDDDISKLNFNDLGAPVSDGAFGFQTFKPPTPFPQYHKIQLRITLTANATTSSPQLRYMVMHYKQRMPQRKVWTVNLLADQNLIGADGRIDARNTLQILTDLDAARKTQQEVVFVDPFGVSNRVYVEEVASTIQILRAGQSPSSIVVVTLVEVIS